MLIESRMFLYWFIILPIRENSYPGLGFEPNWEVVFHDIFHFFLGNQDKSFHELVPGEGIEPPNQAMNPDCIDRTLDAL